MEKLTVTAVSYLNTKPLLYGLLNSPVASQIDLQLDIPSVCAEKLLNGSAQLGLIPVAVLPELPNARIISDYCIGTIGTVKTVCLYADQPIESLDKIYLDFHSRTSVELLKLLLQEYWEVSPQLVPGSEGYIREIGDKTGALVIGDRTIGLEHKYAYTYDLGLAWQQHTGLPFVFAAWVSTIPVPDAFIRQFNAALQSGLKHIPELMYLLPSPHPAFNLEEYFTRHISYELDARKKEALHRFLKYLDPQVSVQFFDPELLQQKQSHA